MSRQICLLSSPIQGEDEKQQEVRLVGWWVLLAFFRDSFSFHTTQVKIENVTREENLKKFCEVRSLCQCQID
jgi:hypothetical protein